MKLSQFIAHLTADLHAKGDTENVSIGIVVPDGDSRSHRLDAVVTSNTLDVLRDDNYTHGMACIVGFNDVHHHPMNMDWIEKLAQEHGTGGWQTLEDMVRFGNAVAAAVRVECATRVAGVRQQVCDLDPADPVPDLSTLDWLSVAESAVRSNADVQVSGAQMLNQPQSA